MDDFGFSYDYGFGYDQSASSFQSFDDALAGNDSTTYDSLSNFQAFDDVLTDNQGYGWDTTDDSGGTIWATGDAGADQNNFGY